MSDYLMNRTKTIEVDLTISTSAYSAGDVVGGLITLDVESLGGGGIIRRVMLIDDDDEKAAMKLHLFDSEPTTIANDAAYAPAIGDLQAQIGTVEISASDYTTYNGNALAIKDGLAIEFSATTLYAYLVCDATPTYTAAGDLTLRVTVWQD